MSKLITLTTDFGVDDPGVAAMKGAIYGIAPAVTVVDVTHGVPAFDIRRGALEMTRALVWFPPSVHVGVIDPGVGSERRGVVIRTGRGDLLVGPDNGLFDLVADQLGGVVEAFELVEPWYRPTVVGAFASAEDTVDAMELRAFGTGRRTWLRELRFDSVDWTCLVGMVMVAAICLTLRITDTWVDVRLLPGLGG